MERMIGRKGSVVTTLSWLVLAAYSISFFVLMGRVRMGADDFFYACFWDQGFKGFVSATITHFYESSGRVFVHLFCSTALWLGMSAYQLTGTFLLVLLAVLGALVATTGSFEASYVLFPGMRGNKPMSVSDNEMGRLQEKRRFEGALVLFCVGLAGFSLLILREAVLWNAGVFNYLFPVCLQVLFFQAFRKDLQRQNPSKALWAAATLLCILAVFNQADVHAGYARNEPVLQENLEKTALAAGTGAKTLVLAPLPDERYGYENLPVNWNFTEWYIRFYHLPKDIGISVADPSEIPLCVQGVRLSDGIIVREQVQYVPMRVAFEALGYKVYWENNSAVAESGGTKFLFKSASSIVRIQQPGGSQALRLKAPVRSLHAQVHIPVDFLVHTLGGTLEQTTDGYQLTY